jgi:hypothetical protein
MAIKRPTIAELRKLTDPVVTIPYVASIFGIGKTQAYDQIRRGTFPFPTIRRGRYLYVPTAALLKVLGIEPEEEQKRGRRAG